MAVKTYVGSSNLARRVKSIYVGIGDKAHRVLKAYVGDANGIARLVYALFSWEKWNAAWYTYYSYYYTNATTFSSPYAMGYTSPGFDSSTGTFTPRGSTKTVSGESPGTVYIFAGSKPSQISYSRGASTGIMMDPVVTGPYSDVYKGSTYYGDVYAATANAYPANGYQGGYWYVKKT